uniref:Uncharacterized protein n=1 Tax=viral metagenome TaxID=1070528 RepID=A0A6M3JS69_9ZZZZ
MYKKKYKKKPKNRSIEIRTNRNKWTTVELIKINKGYITVKLPSGEIIKRSLSKKIRWGKTRKIGKGGLTFGKKKAQEMDTGT